MSKQIWKYPLKVTDTQVLEMPLGAKALSVQVQNGIPCLWALVKPSARKEKRTVQIFGTGNPVAGEGIFISTFQMNGGELVWHAFITE